MSEKGVWGLTPDQGNHRCKTKGPASSSPSDTQHAVYLSQKLVQAQIWIYPNILMVFFKHTDMKSIFLWYDPHFRNLSLSLSASGSGLSLQTTESSLSVTTTGEAGFWRNASLFALAGDLSWSHTGTVVFLISSLQLCWTLGSRTGEAAFDGGVGPEVAFKATPEQKLALILSLGLILAFPWDLIGRFSLSLSSLDESTLTQTLLLILGTFFQLCLGSGQCCAPEDEAAFVTNVCFWGGFWLPLWRFLVSCEGCATGTSLCFTLGASESSLLDAQLISSESVLILPWFVGIPSKFGEEEGLLFFSCLESSHPSSWSAAIAMFLRSSLSRRERSV